MPFSLKVDRTTYLVEHKKNLNTLDKTKSYPRSLKPIEVFVCQEKTLVEIYITACVFLKGKLDGHCMQLRVVFCISLRVSWQPFEGLAASSHFHTVSHRFPHEKTWTKTSCMNNAINMSVFCIQYAITHFATNPHVMKHHDGCWLFVPLHPHDGSIMVGFISC